MTKEELQGILVGDWSVVTVGERRDTLSYTFNADQTYDMTVNSIGQGVGSKVGVLALKAAGWTGASGPWIVERIGSDLFLTTSVRKFGSGVGGTTTEVIIGEEEMAKAGHRWKVRRISPAELLFLEDDKPVYTFTRKGPALGGK